MSKTGLLPGLLEGPVDREKAHREKIRWRRTARFFEDGGLLDRYERSGDKLYTMEEIARRLVNTVPRLTTDFIEQRFVDIVVDRAFGFRWYGDRQTVRDLVDLDQLMFEPTQYALRPSLATVYLWAPKMRAKRSKWTEWIINEGWPLPPGLAASKPGPTSLPTAEAPGAKPPSGTAPAPNAPVMVDEVPLAAGDQEPAPGDATPAGRKATKPLVDAGDVSADPEPPEVTAARRWLLEHAKQEMERARQENRAFRKLARTDGELWRRCSKETGVKWRPYMAVFKELPAEFRQKARGSKYEQR